MSTNRKPKPAGPAASIEPIDKHLGMKVMQARAMRGMSRPALAELVGVSPFQIEKWETAQNKMAANRLFAVAQELELPVAWFFEGYSHGVSGDQEPPDSALATRQNLALLRTYEMLTTEQRRLIRQMVDQFAVSNQDNAATDSGSGPEANAA